MSQAGPIDVIGGNPEIPTEFITNDGTAVPIANQIEIVTENATVIFSGSGNTVTQDFGITNIVFGSTLPSATTASSNVGIGLNILPNLVDGVGSVAIGEASLNSLVSGSANVAIGPTSLQAYSQSQATAVGYGAMQNVTGTENVAVGFVALQNAVGSSNTAVGFGASQGAVGSQNVAIGGNSMTAASGCSNCTAVGFQSLLQCSGDQNTGFGRAVLNSLTSGTSNTAIGHNSGFNVTGSDNTLIGTSAAANLHGSYNIVIGSQAGSAYASAEASNILIGNSGVVAETNTIRIGTQGAGNSQQDTAFMAGIYGVTPAVPTTQSVIIDSAGQLGTTASLFYEQGTFTPTVGANAADPTVTYGAQRGIYSKIGRQVHVEILITFASYVAGSGNIEIRGLPFIVNSSSLTFPPGSCSLSNATFTGTWVVANAISGSTFLNLSQCAASTGATQLQSGAFNNSTEIGICINYESDS